MKFKYIFLFFAFQLLGIALYSQAPTLINYQAVARDASGLAISTQSVSLKFEIRQSGGVVFTETHTGVLTNNFGLFTTQIGKINTTGLGAVNWESGDLALEVSLDINNGTNFVSFGPQQLVSVPYSMHAASVPATYTNNVLTIGNKTFTISSGTATPQMSLTTSGIGSVTSTGTNTFDINIPAANISGSGAAQVSTLAPNSFSIDVPQTIITPGTNITVAGSFPNYTISSVPPAAVTTSVVGSGAAQVSTLVTDSYSIHVPPTVITQSTNIAIAGSFPNYTISSTVDTPTITPGGVATVASSGSNFTVTAPAPSYNQANGSLSTGTAVTNITPALGISGNTLTVGPTTNTIVLPAAVVPTITPSGVASVTSSGSSFTVNAPVPSYNAADGSLTTGTAVTNITPALGISGNTLTVGPTTNTIVLPAAVVPTITPSGVASVITSGSSFTVNAPAPSYNAADGSLTTGTAVTNITPALGISGNTLTVGPATNTIVLPAAVVPTITPSGVASVITSGSSFTVDAPAPSYNAADGSLTTGTAVTNITPALGISGNTLTVGPATNTISLPAAVLPTITPSGVASVTSSGSSFTVDAPAPSYNAANGALTTGTAVTNITPALGISGNTLTVGPSTNTISLPAAVVPTITPSGVASVITSGSSFTVDAPAPSYNAADGSLTTGTAVTNITPALGISGNTLTVGPATNTISLPAAVVPTITPSGVASVITSGSSFTVDAPAPSYNAANGSLATGTAVTNITQTLAISGNTLTIGPATNTISLPVANSWSLGGNAGTSAGTNFLGTTDTQPLVFKTNNAENMRISTAGNVGIGNVSPASKLDIIATPTATGIHGINVGVTSALASGTNNGIYSEINGSSSGNYISGEFNAYRTPASSSGTAIAVKAYGKSNNATNGFVRGIDATGAWGANNIGVSATAIGGPGATNYGLYSTASGGSTNWAGWLEGHTAMNGKLAFMGQATAPSTAGGQGIIYYDQATNKLKVSQNNGAYVDLVNSSTNWGVTGTAGTTPGTNFIGTTDAKDLQFKTNNTLAATIYTTGAVGINTGDVGGKLNVSNTTNLSNKYGIIGEMNYTPSSSGGQDAGGYFVNNLSGGSGSGSVFNAGAIGVSQQFSGNNGSIYTGAGIFDLIGMGGSNSGKAAGLFSFVENLGSTYSNVYGGYFEFLQNGGTINNAYGLYVGSVRGTNKWSLYANDATAPSYFAGSVGINTTVPTATLHVAGTTRLVDGTQGAGKILTSDANGNASWQTPSSGWGITGNAGTVPGTNFLGTTDAQDLAFRTNNTEKIRLTSAGNMGIGISAPASKLQVDGNISLEPASGDAPSRIIGFPAASSGNHGSLTIQAKSNPNSGTIFAGGDLLLSGGNYNHSSAPTGGYGGNVTIRTGRNMYNSTGGSDIVFMAGGNTSTHFERMRIVGYNGNVGINTAAPTATLHVVGSTRLVDGTQGAGKVLASDANGNASWANSAINTGFSVFANTSQSIPPAVFTPVNFGSEEYDDGNNFSGNAYTCPTAGLYHFDASVSWTGMTNSSSWVHIVIYINGVGVKYAMVPSFTGFFSGGISGDFKCSAAASVQVRVYQQQSGAQDIYGTIGYTYFSGHRVY